MSKRAIVQPPTPAEVVAPEPLTRLLAPVHTLPGVGPRLAALLVRLLTPPGKEARCIDLLCHLPHAVIERTLRSDLHAIAEGERVTIEVKVQVHEPPARLRYPYKVICWTGEVFLHLVFFNARPAYLAEVLPPGARRIVSGRLSRFGPEYQIVHPELIAAPEAFARDGSLQPVYPLTEGLGNRLLARVMASALEVLGELAEWQAEGGLQAQGWPGFADALRRVHKPQVAADIEPHSPARRRLAYDEFLAGQLALALVRRGRAPVQGRAIRAPGRLHQAVLRALPFALTHAQERALAEIDADMAEPVRMLRLLQGDVGSGKTLVALLAMLNAVEAGHQAALLAPTELLARQHAATLARLLAPVGLEPLLLVGRERGGARRAVFARIRDGTAAVVIGTHALFQKDVEFADLALVVVDEQHRFGVEQRMALLGKAEFGDLLVMTATPIPRTLVLSLYGDMAVSELREKPPGRHHVRTRVMPLSRMDKLLAGIARVLRAGDQIYWVCPLIEAGEDDAEGSEAAAASARYEALRAAFGERVGLVHGRMPTEARTRAMRAFAAGQLQILVATTVIEVGVDVPAASVIVVEGAERFGLAQLHQLRGRVGRGSRPSSCLLLYGEPLGANARARLAIMRRTDDGFRIAEADLRLRGPGELLGTRQSGLPAFRLADLAAHADLIAPVHEEVQRILRSDPMLESARGHALRALLRLFARDAAEAYLRSG